MMNNPLFRNFTNQQPSYATRSIPLRKTERKSSPKVVSIPVQFISSDQTQTKPLISKNSAAIKIQRVFRSFLVRKRVKKINSIKAEVTEIERKVNEMETVNLIRNNPKERLRVNEMLMSLLFKLDSIRGVDSGVRELRKTVTKKAIALQEKVDSIAQSNDSDKVTETVKEATEESDSVKLDSIAQSNDPDKVTEAMEECDSVKLDSIAQSNDPDKLTETVKEAMEESDSVKLDSTAQFDDPDKVTETVNEAMEKSDSVKLDSAAQSNDPDKITETVNEAMKECDSVKSNDSNKVTETVKEAMEKCDSVKPDSVAQSNDSDKVTETVKESDSVKSNDPDKVTETVNKAMEEFDSVKVDEASKVMKKLMDDNEKMMKLMMQINERNEMQTRMINSLTRRIDQLEKGFMNDNKLRKKKKTKSGLRRRDRDDFYF